MFAVEVHLAERFLDYLVVEGEGWARVRPRVGDWAG